MDYPNNRFFSFPLTYKRDLFTLQSYEVQFFAATTLHAKISKQWNEVPEAEYAVLKERLLNSVRRPNIPLCILIKLCQAVMYPFLYYLRERKEHK